MIWHGEHTCVLVGYVYTCWTHCEVCSFQGWLVSDFRGHSLGRLWGQRELFYSRVGVPVVYTPKNLLYGLAFSDFVWAYYASHYKMNPNA